MRKRLFEIQILLVGLIVFIATSGSLAQAPAGTGQIQGTVVNPQGQPVPKATVTVQLQRAPGDARFRASVFTGDDGSFVATGVPDGTFTICVQVPGTALLNPCRWSATPPSVTVTSGQTASAGTIQLQEGQLLKVRLDDASRALELDEGRIPGAHVMIGVWAPNGLFIPMRVRTKDATSRELEIPVPAGTPVELSVSSGHFDLSDENNARVESTRGARVPIQATAGAPPRVFRFNVNGRRTPPGRP